VNGAANPEDARKAVRAVARSILVRTSWFGNEPNWGRVINALGYSGAEMDAGLVDLSYDACTVLEKGRQVSDFDAGQVSRILANNQFSVNIDLNMGEYSDVIYTCDCSVEYVRINAEYMT
jgi:glutamate N-acetyltransferase/amino-acid N-acetyltransferase